MKTAKYPESLCPRSVLPPLGRRGPPPARTLLPVHSSYGLMRQSRWLSPPSVIHLVPRVSAGCYQPLLPAGSSRLYLCKSFPRCLVPCPDGPTECSYLFLPRCHRPSPRHYGSASRFVPRTRLSAWSFRGCRHFVMFRPLSLRRLPDRSYRCESPHRAAETFTSGHIVLCYLRTLRICYPSDTGN